jgi:hypothetical protein
MTLILRLPHSFGLGLVKLPQAIMGGQVEASLTAMVIPRFLVAMVERE